MENKILMGTNGEPLAGTFNTKDLHRRWRGVWFKPWTWLKWETTMEQSPSPRQVKTWDELAGVGEAEAHPKRQLPKS